MSDILTISDAAKILDKPASTVSFYERTGQLPAKRTQGGVRIFSRIDVENFKAAREKKLAAGASK